MDEYNKRVYYIPAVYIAKHIISHECTKDQWLKLFNKYAKHECVIYKCHTYHIHNLILKYIITDDDIKKSCYTENTTTTYIPECNMMRYMSIIKNKSILKFDLHKSNHKEQRIILRYVISESIILTLECLGTKYGSIAEIYELIIADKYDSISFKIELNNIDYDYITLCKNILD